MPPINFVMQINGKQLAMRDKADLLIARLIIIVIFFTKYVNAPSYFALRFVLRLVFLLHLAVNGNARFIAD